MNTSELIATVAKKASITQKDAKAALEALAEVVTAQAALGDDVTIFGFGKFKPVHREGKVARNPKTGEPIRVPARTVLKFRPSSGLSL